MNARNLSDDHLRTLVAMTMLAPSGAAPIGKIARALRITPEDVRERCRELERHGLTTQTHGARPQWIPTTAGRRRARGFAVA